MFLSLFSRNRPNMLMANTCTVDTKLGQERSPGKAAFCFVLPQLTRSPLSDLMSIIVSTVSYRMALPTFLLVSVFVATCEHKPCFSHSDRGSKQSLVSLFYEPARECRSWLRSTRRRSGLKSAAVSISGPGGGDRRRVALAGRAND